MTLRAVRSYLSVQPESTVDEIAAGTALVRQTVAAALERIAVHVDGTWPRRWTLGADHRIAATTLPKEHAAPIAGTWARWIKAVRNWPVAIGKLGELDDPRQIAAGLEQLAINASALAVSFRTVQDEPDWRQRIGAEK